MSANFCKYCGFRRYKEAAFCTNCGKPFNIKLDTNFIPKMDSDEDVEKHLGNLDNLIQDISETESYSKVTRAEKKSKLVKYYYVYERYSIEELAEKFKVSQQTIERILIQQGLDVEA